MDDVLIFGHTQQEHDTRLHAVLRKIQSAGATLNKEKSEFSKDLLTFLGHVIDKQGVSPDPHKTSAVAAMEKPKTPKELRRFMGMVNQLGKFTPNIAEISQPLRELLSSKKTWLWGPPQDTAFEQLKRELTQPTVLTLYNPDAKQKISADASAYGLGAVLLQQQSTTHWKPVAYASRSMSETEQRYSQIEKEALAIVWACEKFADFVVGKQILLETDHKPLVLIPFSVRHISIECRRECYDFDYALRDLTTASNMSWENSCTRHICFHVLQLALSHSLEKVRIQSSSCKPLLHTYLRAKTVSMTNESLRKQMPPVPS